jgi:hypothetical protein
MPAVQNGIGMPLLRKDEMANKKRRGDYTSLRSPMSIYGGPLGVADVG